MPSWLLGGGAEGPASQRRRFDPPASSLTVENQKKLVLLMAKAVLKNSLDIRELQSAVLTTLIIDKGVEVVKAAVASTQAHNSKASELRAAGKIRDCEALGEPHLHVWGSVLFAVTTSKHVSEEEREIIRKLLADAGSNGGVKFFEPHVHVARCKKCYDPKKMRFVFCVDGTYESILNVVVKAMQGEGAQLKRGVAPRSGNEREMQALLDALVQDS